MKKTLFFSLLIVVLFSCDNPPVDPVKKELKFTSLSVSDSILTIDEFTTLNAVAEGDELIYSWHCDLGTFVGSGKSVMWAGCHSDTFEISCTVSDKYQKSLSKSVFCYVY